MAIPNKTKESLKLVWRKNPDGGHYADYKLGTIIRWKIRNEFHYHIRTSYNKAYNAVSLSDAKRKIDAYTQERIALYEKERKTTKSKKR